MALVLGLMSGTSMDGMDAALVDIRGDLRPRIRLIGWRVFPYPKGLRRRLLQATTVDDICRLNFEVGEVFASAALRLLKKLHISPARVTAIGSHGQTIRHLGREGTLQLGEPAVIAERTGVTTVADFRARDVAAGGLGAPLIPYLHHLLFRSERENRAVHNLGGISNLTYLPKSASIDRVIGFDTGPANMVLDGLWATQHPGGGCDRGGSLAARGHVSLILLKELLRHPFFKKLPPKTAGREEFGAPYVKDLMARSKRLRLRFEDLLATATALTAVSLADQYRRFIYPRGVPSEVIFGGGGVHNRALMTMIRAELSGTRVRTLEDHGWPSDAMEAVCFAVLAHQTLHGVATNIPSVTGAKHAAVLGQIIPGGVL